MKVLLINLRIGTGSVGRIVSDLYHGTTEAGYNCKIAFARGDTGDVPTNDTYRICSEKEVMLHAGLTRLFGNTSFYFSNSTKAFCDWIDTYKPDVVHIHGLYGYYVNMKVLFDYLAEKSIAVITTLHSCWDYTGHCCYYTYSGCDQWKTGCKKCKNKSSYPKSSFFDNTSYNFIRKKTLYDSIKKCVIVAPSTWIGEEVKKSFLSQKQVRVIKNGIDLVSFRYTSNCPAFLNKAKPIILCVANIWDKRKGWDDIVELSFLIPNDIQLVVIGVTEKQKKALNPNTISIIRTNSKSELASLYSNSTVLFNPTYEDNYPTVNLEAAACCLPVVTYRTGGSPEILEFGNWGIVINKKDFDSLFNYTRAVFNKTIVPDYSNQNMLSNRFMVDKYLALYNEIVETDKI